MTAPAWTPEMEERALELLANATPAPWHADSIARAVRHLDRNVDWYAEDCPGGFNLPGRYGRDGSGGGEADGALIAAAPDLLPAALAEIARLRAEVKKLETEIADYALTRVAGHLGPSPEQVDEADRRAGRARAKRRK